MSIADTVDTLDLPEENISTLLCYLESTSLPDRPAIPWIKLTNPVYSKSRIQCYGGPLQLKAAANKCPPLAAAIALQLQKGADFTGVSRDQFHFNFQSIYQSNLLTAKQT